MFTIIIAQFTSKGDFKVTCRILVDVQVPVLTTSAFPNRGDGKLCPPHLKGNMDSPIKFINCAMFPENKAGKCFSTFHHQEIPRRNSIVS